MLMILILLSILIILCLIWFVIIVLWFEMENMFLIGIKKGWLIVCIGFGMYLFRVFISFCIVGMLIFEVLFFNVFNVDFLIIGVLLFGNLYIFSSLCIFILISFNSFLLLIMFVLFRNIMMYGMLIWWDNKMCLWVWGIGLFVVE